MGDSDAHGQSNYKNQNGLPVFALQRGDGQKSDEGEAGDGRPQAWGTRVRHGAPSLARAGGGRGLELYAEDGPGVLVRATYV